MGLMNTVCGLNAEFVCVEVLHMVGGSVLDIVIELSPVHAMQFHVHGSGSGAINIL
jgi:hypothetical protein